MQLPRYVSLTVLSRLENEAPLNLSHREGDLLKHKVVMIENPKIGLLIKAKRSGNAVKAAHRRGVMEINNISFAECNPSTAIGEEAAACCTRCKSCVMHGYATAESRRPSLAQFTDMISIEPDVIRKVPTELSEIGNIMATLETGIRETVSVEQHLSLPPAEEEAPTPFRVEKVQAGTHFVNAFLLEIPRLAITTPEKENGIPDEKIANIYGEGDYEKGVKALIYDFVKALPHAYLTCFAMESRNRPILTPLRALLITTFDPSTAAVPPTLLPSITCTTVEEVTKWYDYFMKQETGSQYIEVLSPINLHDLRDKILKAIANLLPK
jgi:hypothetical protein